MFIFHESRNRQIFGNFHNVRKILTIFPLLKLNVHNFFDYVCTTIFVKIRQNFLFSILNITLQGLDQDHLHPLHRASETEESQQGTEPGTYCTAGEHSMQRAIRTALLTTIRILGLYYYNISIFEMLTDFAFL